MLDLRENPGGLLDEAVDTASLFLPAGEVVVTTTSRTKGDSTKKSGSGRIVEVPFDVLIDRGTASAAEILTAALQDDAGATVVGTRSYGKGVFQEEHGLANGGALKLTVGEYFTPNGTNLGAPGVKNGRNVARGPGIKPQVYVAEKPNSRVDTQLQVAENTVVAKLHR